MPLHPKPKTDAEPSLNAQAFYVAAQETMAYLLARWFDEREYEDVRDYEKPLAPIAAEHNTVIVRMRSTKWSLTAEFACDGRTYLLTMTRRSYAFRRIA